MARKKARSGLSEIYTCLLSRCRSSTIVGVSHVICSKTLFERLLWSIILVVSSILTVYGVVEVFKSFYSYPSRTDVHVVYEKSVRQ